MKIKQYELKQTDKFHTKKFLVETGGDFYRLEYFKSLNTTTCIYKLKKLGRKKYDMMAAKYQDVEIFLADYDRVMVEGRIAKVRRQENWDLATCLKVPHEGMFEERIQYVCKGRDRDTLKVYDAEGSLCTVARENFELKVAR